MVPQRSVIAVAWRRVRLPRTIPATIDTAMIRAYGPGTAAKAAVVKPPSAIRVVVRAVAVVRRARAAYRVRPRVCPAPPIPRAQAAWLGGVAAFQQEWDEGDDHGVHREAGQGEGGGEQEERSAGPDSVSAFGRMCGAGWGVGPGCAQGQGVGGGGDGGEDGGEDEVGVAPGQVVGDGRGQGCEDGGGKSAGEGDDGQGADVVGCPPAGEGGERRLVEGGGHRESGEHPTGDEEREVRGRSHDQQADDSECRPCGHDGTRAAMVEDVPDADSGEGGDDETEGERRGGRPGRPAGRGGDLRIEDGEGVVDDAPAHDLRGAEGGQGGAGPRPVPCSGRGPAS